MSAVEISHCTMVSEEISTTEELRSEINVTIVLKEAIVAQL